MCMCMCMCTCRCMCMGRCRCRCISLSLYIYLSLSLYIYIYTYTYVCIHASGANASGWRARRGPTNCIPLPPAVRWNGSHACDAASHRALLFTAEDHQSLLMLVQLLLLSPSSRAEPTLVLCLSWETETSASSPVACLECGMESSLSDSAATNPLTMQHIEHGKTAECQSNRATRNTQ